MKTIKTNNFLLAFAFFKKDIQTIVRGPQFFTADYEGASFSFFRAFSPPHTPS